VGAPQPIIEEQAMTDLRALIDSYIAGWNETDPARRREIIAATWTEDASYLDPLLSGEGHDGIDAMIAGAQEQFPGHRFELSDGPDAHHDRIRFAWKMYGEDGDKPVAAGVDFGTLSEDGRLRAVTGFLEPLS
jgi:SnoaL-like domain